LHYFVSDSSFWSFDAARRQRAERAGAEPNAANGPPTASASATASATTSASDPLGPRTPGADAAAGVGIEGPQGQIPHQNGGQQKPQRDTKGPKGRNATRAIACKKKYKINSYLFNIICKFPRRYVYNFIRGREVSQKYHTMFFHLTAARLLSNKMLRAYYRHLSAKALRNICNESRTRRQRGRIPSGTKHVTKNEIVKY
jgi:hypothetical protein